MNAFRVKVMDTTAAEMPFWELLRRASLRKADSRGSEIANGAGALATTSWALNPPFL